MLRPKTYTYAAILQFVISVLAVVLGAISLIPGSRVAEGIPFPVVLVAFAIGVMGLVSAYGVWRNQRWGVILTIVLRAVDGLAAAPGIVAAPDAVTKSLAITGVVTSIAVIVLLLWPTKRHAIA